MRAQVWDVPLAGAKDGSYQVRPSAVRRFWLHSFTKFHLVDAQQQASCTTGLCRKGQEPEIPEPSITVTNVRPAPVSAFWANKNGAPTVNLPLGSTVNSSNHLFQDWQKQLFLHVHGSNHVSKCFTVFSITSLYFTHLLASSDTLDSAMFNEVAFSGAREWIFALWRVSPLVISSLCIWNMR